MLDVDFYDIKPDNSKSESEFFLYCTVLYIIIQLIKNCIYMYKRKSVVK